VPTKAQTADAGEKGASSDRTTGAGVFCGSGTARGTGGARTQPRLLFLSGARHGGAGADPLAVVRRSVDSGKPFSGGRASTGIFFLPEGRGLLDLLRPRERLSGHVFNRFFEMGGPAGRDDGGCGRPFLQGHMVPLCSLEDSGTWPEPFEILSKKGTVSGATGFQVFFLGVGRPQGSKVSVAFGDFG